MSAQISDAQIPAISIVTPVYNGERYLEETLETIERQTFTDFELICVDDGSTDGSLAILEAHARKDERYRVVQGEHRGGGAARNLGLDHAQGEYIIFLDSDDLFEPVLLEHAYARIRDTDADMVVFDGMTFNRRTGHVNENYHFLYRWLINKYKFFDQVFNRDRMPKDITRITNPAPWLRLYRRQFILDQHLRFQEIANTNDYLFGHLSLICADRVAALDEQLVRYSTNNPSGTQATKSGNPTCIIQAADALYKELVERDLYDTVVQSFVASTLESVAFALKSLKPAGRDIFLDALNDGGLSFLADLTSERAFYHHKLSYDNLHLLRSAMAERRYRKALAEATDPEPTSPADGAAPLVSVVMPVHNDVAHLQETIDSILAQTIESLEVVCVDDGSDDGSDELLDTIAAQEPRMSVVHLVHRGTNAALDAGIKRARGHYLAFLACGDTFVSDALDTLTARADADELDVLLYDCTPFSNDDTQDMTALRTRYHRHGIYEPVSTGSDLMAAMRRVGDYQPDPFLQLVKRSLLVDRCDRTALRTLCDEQGLCFELLLEAKRAGYLKGALCNRLVKPASSEGPELFAESYGLFHSYRLITSLLEAHVDDLSADDFETFTNLAIDVLSMARKRFLAVPENDRGRIFGLGRFYAGYQRLVATPALADARSKERAEQIKALQEQLDECKEQIAEMERAEESVESEAPDRLTTLRDSGLQIVRGTLRKPYHAATKVAKAVRNVLPTRR